MQLFSTETRRRLDEGDRRWPIKLGLRAFATFLAVPALILFAASTSLSTQQYGGDDWVDAMPLAPVLLALLYNPIHLLFTIHPMLHRSIHPAAPLTMDILIWGLALPGLVFSVGDGWFWFWQPVELSVDGDFVLCDFALNFWSEPCNPMIYVIGRMEIAANVFLALILIAHFILFVYSCIAAHRHRLAHARSSRERRNIELQYHRDPESHRASAPPPPPQYTPFSTSNPQSTTSPHHQPSSPISKSIDIRAANNLDNDISAGYKSLEAGQSPPLHEHRLQQQQQQQQQEHSSSPDEWTRSSDLPPRLGSPVSPINSGSGGGFMDAREFSGAIGHAHGDGNGEGEGDGPFADHFAVKYA